MHAIKVNLANLLSWVLANYSQEDLQEPPFVTFVGVLSYIHKFTSHNVKTHVSKQIDPQLCFVEMIQVSKFPIRSLKVCFIRYTSHKGSPTKIGPENAPKCDPVGTSHQSQGTISIILVD